ncbi:uncharacterized protein [Triticum aestivum]|uniref:uncharacterized protein n=1 Tax=Triticum aestivum TaxID=4565 RepID=UPI001D01D8AB|nr:uncharacterized protein LOC123040724 [Triticum aestivum]
MTVPEPEMPASARRRLFLARFDALIFLHCGLLWVICAVYLALVIARLALGKLEIPPALWAASWVCAYIVLCLTPVSTFLVGARSSRSVYNPTDANKDPAMIGVLFRPPSCCSQLIMIRWWVCWVWKDVRLNGLVQ